MIQKPMIVVTFAVLIFPVMGLVTDGEFKEEIAYIPIICQVEKDHAELVAVYYLQMGNLTQFTLVFSDEYHPVCIIDKIYRLFRIVRYHRIADLETFYIRVENGTPVEIIFSHEGTGTYSSNQTYDVLLPRHYEAVVPFSEFECNGSRPYIYVNTWNHLMSERKTNECGYITYSNCTIVHGDRQRAEEDYRIW